MKAQQKKLRASCSLLPLKFYDAESIPILHAALTRALTDGTPFVIETGLTTMTGKHIWTEVRGLGRVDEGNQAFVMGTFLDVTERKRAEEALRASEERLRLAVEAARAGIWEWNVRTNENVWSDEVWALYGLEKEERPASFDTWQSVIHPDDQMQAVRALMSSRLAESEINLEWRVRVRDGAVRWLMIRGEPQRNAAGEVERYLGIVMDITDRKQAEQDLLESEQRFRDITYASADWLWEVDTSGRYTFASPSVKEVLHLPFKIRRRYR